MGRIVTPVLVASALDSSKQIRFDALVDTDASGLVLPSAWRDQLGSLPTARSIEMETADQRLVRGEVVGPVSIQIEGFDRIFSEVIFIEMQPQDGGYEPLVGYIVLEQSRAAVDMVGHRLVPVKHFDLKGIRPLSRKRRGGSSPSAASLLISAPVHRRTGWRGTQPR